jgi:hypothetical protein
VQSHIFLATTYEMVVENDVLDLANHKAFFSTIFKFFHPVLISQTGVGYCVTYGRKYDSFEKMILPFDDVTWYLIIISFATGFITILILYRCPRQQQSLYSAVKSKTLHWV